MALQLNVGEDAGERREGPDRFYGPISAVLTILTFPLGLITCCIPLDQRFK